MSHAERVDFQIDETGLKCLGIDAGHPDAAFLSSNAERLLECGWPRWLSELDTMSESDRLEAANLCETAVRQLRGQTRPDPARLDAEQRAASRAFLDNPDLEPAELLRLASEADARARGEKSAPPSPVHQGKRLIDYSDAEAERELNFAEQLQRAEQLDLARAARTQA